MGLEGQVKSRPTHSTPCEAMAALPRHVPPTTALLSAAACTGWGAHPTEGLTPQRGWPRLGKSPLSSRRPLSQEAVLLMLTFLTTRQNTWQQLLIICAVPKYFTLTNIVIKYLQSSGQLQLHPGSVWLSISVRVTLQKPPRSNACAGMAVLALHCTPTHLASLVRELNFTCCVLHYRLDKDTALCWA